MGFVEIFIFLPILPEMIERMQVALDIHTGEDPLLDSELNDKINDLYGFTYVVTMFFSPIIGSYLYT